MSLADDLQSEVEAIFATRWKARDGQKVPEAPDVQLGNDAVKLTATVLYADLAESTRLVTSYPPHFAAEIYKSYLHCAAKVISNNGGVITAYDGDRIMAVFIGNLKNTSAAKSALQINYCVTQIINPKMHNQYPDLDSSFIVRQAVGIDTSELFVARTGIRGANDLVWVGRAANYAAKLCEERTGAYSSWITEDVYKVLAAEAKLSQGKDMWERALWLDYGIYVYRSSYWWKP